MGSQVSRIKSRVSSLLEKIPIIGDGDDEEGMKIITRAEWSARVPKWREDLVYPALSATTVYTGTDPCWTAQECTKAVQDIQAQHMDQDGLPDIQYSFLVGGDGRVYEGRGWQTVSSRSTLIKCVDPEFPPPTTPMINSQLKKDPNRQIVIALIGDEEKSPATDVMNAAVRDLVNHGIETYYLYTGEQEDGVTAEEFMKGVAARKKREEEGESSDYEEE